MVKIAVSVVAFLAAVASAYTKADMSVGPSGNSIETPKKNQQVTAGKTFDVTWDVTSKGTVTLYLCVGLSDNCVNQDVPFADQVANSGTFSWSVPTTLAPSTTEGFGYGVMIISDQDNKIYNWSPQFGISNAGYSASSSSSSASYSASSSASGSGYATTSSYSAKSTYVSATGGYNSTVVQPTGTMTVPSTLQSYTASTPTGSSTGTGSPAQSTGAAGMLQVGFGAVFGGVIAALAL